MFDLISKIPFYIDRRFGMKRVSLLAFTAAASLVSGELLADTIFVDFSDEAGSIGAAETYNTLVPTSSGASTSLELVSQLSSR